MKSRGDIPIILCCSEDDEPALAKVVDELLREGMAPELVPGVEFDGNLLSSAVDAAAPDALFVLCTSMALDKTVARKLTGLFSARSGRGQRIISAAFTPSRPLAILPAIRGALKEMRLADDAAPDEEQERATNLRDIVEAFAEPELMAVPTPRPSLDAEALARELALGMAEAAAILERRGEHELIRTPMRGGPRPQPHTPSRAPAASRAPVAAPQPVAPAPRPQPVAGNIERRLESALPHVDELVTDGEPSRKIPRQMMAAPGRALADEHQGNRWLLAFAGIGIAGIVVLALMQLLRPGAPEVPTRSAELPGTAVPASNEGGARTAPPLPDAAATRVAGMDTGGEPPSPEGSKPAPLGVVADVPPAPVDRTAPPEPSKPDTKAASVPPPPRKGAVSKRDIEEAALVLAAQEGKLVKIGRLFVLRGADDELSWTDASGRCAGRRVNGIGGFRLPGVSELKRMRAAKVIGTGSWWTRGKGAADDEAIAFDAGSGATNVYLTVEPNGRAICVRTL